MKKPSLASGTRRLGLLIAVAALSLFAPRSVEAQVFATWQGTGTNWSDAANWSTNYGYGQLQWTGSGNTTSFNDIGGAAQWRYYFSGGTTYNLSGSNITFYDFGGARGGILSDSTVVQNIAMDLTFQDGGRPTFILTRDTGGLTFSNILVTTATTALGIGGSNSSSTIRFNGTISGTNSIVIGTNSFDLGTAGMAATRAVFAGSNTYDGTTTVNLGALFVANNNALGSTNSGTTVNSGGSLLLSNGVTISGETLTLNGLGSSSFAQGTLATFTGAGSNNYAGNININGGEVRIQAYGGTTLALSGTLTSATNRTLYIGGNGTTIISNALVGFNSDFGNGALWKDFDGNLVLLGDNSTGLTGTFQHKQGTVTITNANSLGSGRYDLGGYAAAATLQVNATTARSVNMSINNDSTNGVINVTNNQIFTLDANLSNSGGGSSASTKFGKAGAGTLILAGSASTYAGQVQIGNGTVVLGNSSSLGTNVTTSTRAIDLGLNVNDVVQANNVALLVSNGVTLSNSIYVASNLSSATRTIGISGAGNATFNNEIYLDGTLTADSGASGNLLTISGGLVNSGGLIKTGAGTLTLSGNNTYTGATDISNGVVRIGTADAFGATNGGTTVRAGAAIQLTNVTGFSFAEDLNIRGTGTNNGVLQNMAGANTNTGKITLAALARINAESGSSLTLAGPMDTGGQLVVFGGVGNITVSGAITNTGALTKDNVGTLTLTASNSFTGTTTVAASAKLNLNAAGGGALAGTTNVVVSSGTARLIISQSNQVNDTAAVSLSGGTIAKGAGVINETMGALGLGATSFLDFGSGTGNFTFASFSPSTFQLTFQNFNLGNSLTVTTGTFAASEFDFNGFGYTFSTVPSGGFTITAVPEPSTVLAAIGLAGMMLWPMRRFVIRRPRGVV